MIKELSLRGLKFSIIFGVLFLFLIILVARVHHLVL